jgi:hypothetical protein
MREESKQFQIENGGVTRMEKGGGDIFANCEGETKTDITTKYECLQTSWKYGGLKGKTRNK